MSIKAICTTNVITIDKSSSLKDVSNLMRKQHVGAVVVTQGLNGKRVPVGIITDRDVGLSLGVTPNPQDLIVENLMLYKPVTVNNGAGVLEATSLMRINGVKRLPVVNDDGTLYGIISSDDLLMLLGDEIRNLSKITDIQIKKEQGIRTPYERQAEL